MPEDEADDADAGPGESDAPPATPEVDESGVDDPTAPEEADVEDPEAEPPAGADETGDDSGSVEGGSATDRGPTSESGTGVTAAGSPPETGAEETLAEDAPLAHDPGVPEDVRKYDRFTKIDGSTYDRANEFLRDRTYVTAREWAIARLCADFRTETGVEMTKIGENLPELVPFMTDTYSPQAVNQARASFEEKVRKSGATFLYGAMSDFFTAEELDDVMYEATEVAKFLLEVEGVDLSVEEELEAEDQISEVMREVREHSAALRHDEVTCPECGHEIRADGE